MGAGQDSGNGTCRSEQIVRVFSRKMDDDVVDLSLVDLLQRLSHAAARRLSDDNLDVRAQRSSYDALDQQQVYNTSISAWCLTWLSKTMVGK